MLPRVFHVDFLIWVCCTAKFVFAKEPDIPQTEPYPTQNPCLSDCYGDTSTVGAVKGIAIGFAFFIALMATITSCFFCSGCWGRKGTAISPKDEEQQTGWAHSSRASIIGSVVTIITRAPTEDTIPACVTDFERGKVDTPFSDCTSQNAANTETVSTTQRENLKSY